MHFFEWRSWKKIDIFQVFVVVLILRDHLLEKEDEDQRETAGFQEEPSRTSVPSWYSFGKGIYSSAVTVP